MTLKPIPAILVVVLAVAAGGLVATAFDDSLAGSDRMGQDEASRREAVAEAAAAIALERIAALDAEISRTTRDDSEILSGLLEIERGKAEDLAALVAIAEAEVAEAEASLADPEARTARFVKAVALRILREPMSRAKILLASLEPEVRRQGVRALAEAARAGEEEAFDLLRTLWTDPDDGVADLVRRTVRDLARRAGGEADRGPWDGAQEEGGLEPPALARMLHDSGLEALLVDQLATSSERDRRDVLRALAALKNPAAEQGWLQIYTAADQDARRIEAARELRQMGVVGPFDDMMQRFSADLASADDRAANQAIRNITRLGGDEARAILEAALAADPDSAAARRIQRSLRMLDRPDARAQQGRRGARGGRGGRDG